MSIVNGKPDRDAAQAAAFAKVSPDVRYVGIRTASGGEVWVSRGDAIRRLSPRFDLRRHSPTGFEWGYGGSGPAQLAPALLADWSGNNRFALKHYQTFKFKVIASLSKREWELTSKDIRVFAATVAAPKSA